MVLSKVQRPNERKVLTVVCIGAFLFFNSIGSISVALPAIQAQFGSSLAAIQWIAIIGVVMISTFSLCFGRAGDILGRRRLYITGVALYALGSGLSALAASFLQLLGFRIVMTLGLAMATPMAGAIVAATFPPQRRGQALGIYASAIALGRATGPTIGGLILHAWGWRAIFVTNFLLGLLVSLAVFAVLREREQRRAEPFDLGGALSLLVGYPALLIAFSVGANSDWRSPQVPIWFGLAGIGLISFVLAELRAERPLVQLSFFKSLPFTAAIVSLVLSTAVQQPLTIIAPLFMKNVLAFSALAIGLVMTSLPVSTGLASLVSGRLADKVGARYVATFGLCVLLLGLFFYAQLGLGATALGVAAALALIGVGTGFFTPANQAAAFATAGREHYGVLSAMLTSFGTASGTLGTTVTVALLEGRAGGREAHDPLAFADAQQFAFLSLLPLAAIAALVSFVGRPRKAVQASPTV